MTGKANPAKRKRDVQTGRDRRRAQEARAAHATHTQQARNKEASEWARGADTLHLLFAWLDPDEKAERTLAAGRELRFRGWNLRGGADE